MMKFGDFLDRVCGSRYKTTLSASRGLFEFGGKGESISYLIRKDDQGNDCILIVPPAASRDTCTTEDVVRSACIDLGINPADFGIPEQIESED